MSPLRLALEDYLSLRRSLGFKLERAGKLLAQFVVFCEDAGADVVTTELALAWAALPEGGPNWVGHRLSVVRSFARYLVFFDQRTQVPPTGLWPEGTHRASPYLYSPAEVKALMAAASRFSSPLRRATLSSIVGLLYVSGMRVGEALRLDRHDVDLTQGLVVVHLSKFGKSRALPLHSSTVDALSAYAELRDKLCPRPRSEAFFVSLAGTRVLYCNFHLAFVAMVSDAGIARRSATCRPRPHDLRHSFAVSTLVSWYAEGADVEGRLAQLSTYLGHIAPAHTYWYVSAAPELLALAAARLEAATTRRP